MQTDITKDVKTRSDTSRYPKDDNRPLPIGKNKNILDMMKGRLCGKIMTEFVALRVKMYTYRNTIKRLEDNRFKGAKKCVVTGRLT